MNTATAIRAAGAATRLTRLVTLDTLLEGPRVRIQHWANTRKHGDYTYDQAENDPHWLAKLVGCTWCAGVWVSAAVVASAHLFGHTRAWKLAADALTTSMAAAVVVNRTDA